MSSTNKTMLRKQKSTWHKRSSHSKKVRKRIYNKCDAKGRLCFGRPENLGYPICADKPRITCEPDADGCRAAKHWAMLYGERDIIGRIEKPCSVTNSSSKRRLSKKSKISKKRLRSLHRRKH